MSTYDKYFSERNKSHMYQVIQKIIIQDTGIDIDNYPNYKDMFATHYPTVFEITEGESIVDCNKILIDTLCPKILQDISTTNPHTNSQVMSTDIPTTPLPVKEIQPSPRDTREVFHLFSSERVIDSSFHRYHYQIGMKSKYKTVSIESITLPEEDNPLFAFPMICLRLTLFPTQDTGDISHTEYTLMCRLQDTKYLGDRNYIVYVPDSTIEIPYTPIIQVTILDFQGNPCLHTSDQHVCKQVKIYKKNDTTYTCIELEGEGKGCRAKDILCIIRDSRCISSIQIDSRVSTYLLCKDTPDIKQGDTFLHVAYQNHIEWKGS